VYARMPTCVNMCLLPNTLSVYFLFFFIKIFLFFLSPHRMPSLWRVAKAPQHAINLFQAHFLKSTFHNTVSKETLYSVKRDPIHLA
jgi:hypothetical protein